MFKHASAGVRHRFDIASTAAAYFEHFLTLRASFPVVLRFTLH